MDIITDYYDKISTQLLQLILCIMIINHANILVVSLQDDTQPVLWRYLLIFTMLLMFLFHPKIRKNKIALTGTVLNIAAIAILIGIAFHTST